MRCKAYLPRENPATRMPAVMRKTRPTCVRWMAMKAGPRRTSKRDGETANPFDIDWPVVEAEIAELRGKIARLGTVNIDAIAEQDQLEGRQDQLADEVNDIAPCQARSGTTDPADQ